MLAGHRLLGLKRQIKNEIIIIMFQFKTIEKKADPTDTYIKGFVSNVFKRSSFDSSHEMRSSNDRNNSPQVTQAMY